jgi:hypothetical protein
MSVGAAPPPPASRGSLAPDALVETLASAFDAYRA